MNTVIKQLMAETERIPMGDSWTYDTDRDAVMARFANALVEECAALFPMLYTDQQRAQRIDKTILKHFGMYP